MDVVTVSANLDEVIKRLPTEKLAKTVMARALNRAITAARVQAAREAAKDYAIRQGRITERARIKKPSANRPEAELKFTGPMLNITDYRVTPNRPNPAKSPVLRVTVGKKSGSRPYKGAFLIPTRSGTVRGYRREGQDRYPIRPVFGPSVPQLVGAENVRESVIKRVDEVVITRLGHEINRELMKGAK